jgi:two-component system sensor histidine kinase KdpD
VIGSTLQRMSETLAGRRIDLQLPEDLPLVPLDDVLFQQVLINLFDNSQRYVPSDSPLDLTATVERDWLAIDVGDRGRGFLPGEEERVFEKFYRGEAHRNDQRGTGLGLTICRAIVLAHGGTITGENRPGGGALFHIHLPLKVEETQPSERRQAGATAMGSGKAGRA